MSIDEKANPNDDVQVNTNDVPVPAAPAQTQAAAPDSDAEPLFSKIQQDCDRIVDTIYTALIYPIKKLLKHLFTPIAKLLSLLIIVPCLYLFFILWGIVKYPVERSWHHYLRNQHQYRRYSVIRWYNVHPMETYALLGFVATCLTLALTFILAQTLLLTDIDFTLQNSVVSPQVRSPIFELYKAYSL